MIRVLVSVIHDKRRRFLEALRREWERETGIWAYIRDGKFEVDLVAFQIGTKNPKETGKERRRRTHGEQVWAGGVRREPMSRLRHTVQSGRRRQLIASARSKGESWSDDDDDWKQKTVAFRRWWLEGARWCITKVMVWSLYCLLLHKWHCRWSQHIF